MRKQLPKETVRGFIRPFINLVGGIVCFRLFVCLFSLELFLGQQQQYESYFRMMNMTMINKMSSHAHVRDKISIIVLPFVEIFHLLFVHYDI